MKFDLSKCASVTKKEIGDNNYHISISFNNKSTDAKARLYSYLYYIGITYSIVDVLLYE